MGTKDGSVEILKDGPEVGSADGPMERTNDGFNVGSGVLVQPPKHPVTAKENGCVFVARFAVVTVKMKTSPGTAFKRIRCELFFLSGSERPLG